MYNMSPHLDESLWYGVLSHPRWELVPSSRVHFFPTGLAWDLLHLLQCAEDMMNYVYPFSLCMMCILLNPWMWAVIDIVLRYLIIIN